MWIFSSCLNYKTIKKEEIIVVVAVCESMMHADIRKGRTKKENGEQKCYICTKIRMFFNVVVVMVFLLLLILLEL